MDARKRPRNKRLVMALVRYSGSRGTRAIKNPIWACMRDERWRPAVGGKTVCDAGSSLMRFQSAAASYHRCDVNPAVPVCVVTLTARCDGAQCKRVYI